MLASLENINFFYNSNLLLKDINLSIFPSTLICIVGASGVGKSTLLYILAGLLKPNTGSYYFEGINCYEQNILSLAKFRSNNIGILFQDFRLLPFLSVEQNIKFPMYFSGVSYKKNIVLDLIHQFNLIHCSKLYPHQISGGEAQRVALARAMILSPKLLLLDEFTANLDSETEKNIMNVILSLKKYNLTILCVTHSKYVMSQADTIWRLENKTLKN